MSNTLATILDRAECEPPLFHADEVYHWPLESLEPWLDRGLLRPTTPATALPCSSCGGGHVEEVIFLDGVRGRRAYVPCPEYGPTQIDMSRLRQWEVDLGRLSQIVAAELGCRGHVMEIVPQRFWQLGSAGFAGHRHDVFLGRMLAHHDGCDLFRQQRISKSGIVFVPGIVPRMDFFNEHRPMVLSLQATISPEGDSLHFAKEYFESQVAGCEKTSPRKKIPPKRSQRAALIAALTEELMEHVRTAHEYAHATEEQTGEPRLLPRPTQEQLARRLRCDQSSVSRCLADNSARELRFLWDLALDLDRILHH